MFPGVSVGMMLLLWSSCSLGFCLDSLVLLLLESAFQNTDCPGKPQDFVQQWDHTFPLLCSIHGIKITASVLTAPSFFRKQQGSLLLPPFVLGVRQASLKSGHTVGHRLFCPYSFRSWCGLVCLVFVAVIFKLFIYFHAYGCFAYIHACVLCVCAYYKQKAKEGVASAGTRWL